MPMRVICLRQKMNKKRKFLIKPMLDQNFYYMGAKLANISFSAGLFNIQPKVTFIMALILRIEKLNIARRYSQAKVIRTAITVACALLMILYKGPIVRFIWSTGATYHGAVGATIEEGGDESWLKSTFMLFNTLESYPIELTLTTMICVMGSLLRIAVALVMEHGNTKPWIIGFNMRLFTATYSIIYAY